mgnify:CR=1 FL=1
MSVLEPVTQRVFVGGVEIPVRGCAIDEGINEAARISFVAEVDLDPAAAGITEGGDVRVEQDVGASTYVIRGRIQRAKLQRGESYTYVKVDALGESDAAKHLRFLANYSDPIDIDQLITEVWTDHGPSSVSLGGVNTGAGQIKEFNSTYDSLADMMNDLADLTGWAWRIDNGVLQWFNPVSNSGPALSQSTGDFTSNSINLERSIEQVKNVVREYAIFDERFELEYPVSDDTCWQYLELDQSTLGLNPADGYELNVDPEITVDVLNTTGSGSVDAKIDFENGLVIFDSNYVVFADGSGNQPKFVVKFKTRKTAWVEREDAGSIAIYGRLEASPLDYDGAATVAAVEDRLDAYLANHAFASVNFSADLTRADVRPGQKVTVTLNDPTFSGNLLITNVQRSMSGPDLQVSINAVDVTSTGRRAANRIRNPLVETIRRIERLERAPVNPGNPQGKIARQSNGSV